MFNVAGENILFSAENAAGNPESVNISTSNMSVSNNGAGIVNGEVIRFDFVNDPTIFGPNFGSQYYNYPSHYTANGFSFNMAATTDSSIAVHMRAYDAPDNDPGGTTPATHSAALTVGSQDTITQILVNGTAIDLNNPLVAMGDGSGGYIVFGLDASDQVSIYTSNGYNRIELENYNQGGGDSDGFSVNSLGFNVVNAGDNVPMVFDVELTDQDGDTSQGSIGLTVTPEGGTLTGTVAGESLIGGSLAETLVGGDGNDVLYGGLGADTMHGGAGEDVFVVSPDTLGPITDLIADYNFGGDQDTVDLTELLATLGAGAPTTAAEAAQVVDVIHSGGNTILQVDTDGTGAGNTFEQVAVITGTHAAVNILYSDDEGATSVPV